jgi:hypothetical protein
MKTARFVAVVKASGKPDIHVLLTRPESDNRLQTALKSHRVMTIHQDRIRGKADRGTVGFDPGPLRQFLIFPRSISQFAGRYILAIKYELLQGGDAQSRPLSRAVKRTAKPARNAKPAKSTVSKIIPFAKAAAAESRDREGKVSQNPAEQLQEAIGLLKGGKQAAALKILRNLAKNLRPVRPESSKS